MTTQSGRAQRPVPTPDEASAPFFDGAKRGVLMIQRCTACGTHLFPLREICEQCLGDDLEWVEASGKGTVHTFAVMHQVYHPGLAGDVPYNLTQVELEEGPRMTTNIVGIDNEAIEVGMSVVATFEEVDDGVFLPRFEPAGS